MTAISKNIKTNVTRGAVGTAFAGSLLITAGLGVAVAEPTPPPQPDGSVTVLQGETVVVDSGTAEAAAIAITERCGALTVDVNALVAQVDTEGVSQTVCTGLPAGDVVIAQNAASTGAPSPVVPGTSGQDTVDPAQEPAADVPPGSDQSTEGDLDGAGAGEPPAPSGDTGLGGDQTVNDEG